MRRIRPASVAARYVPTLVSQSPQNSAPYGASCTSGTYSTDGGLMHPASPLQNPVPSGSIARGGAVRAPAPCVLAMISPVPACSAQFAVSVWPSTIRLGHIEVVVMVGQGRECPAAKRREAPCALIDRIIWNVVRPAAPEFRVRVSPVRSAHPAASSPCRSTQQVRRQSVRSRASTRSHTASQPKSRQGPARPSGAWLRAVVLLVVCGRRSFRRPAVAAHAEPQPAGHSAARAVKNIPHDPLVHEAHLFESVDRDADATCG